MRACMLFVTGLLVGVGLHTVAAVDRTYLDWKYLNGTRTVPGTGSTR